MIDNPLLLPMPEDPIEKIYALARDIAYGASHKMWTSHLRVKDEGHQGHFYDHGLNKGLEPKWGDAHNYYSLHLLVAFGYMSRGTPPNGVHVTERDVAFYDVTQKAFSLLEKPSTLPTVFISYRREHQSSALGLYVEARLKLAGNPNPFIDKNIPAGSNWHGHLEDIIQNCSHFICLIAPQTLESEMVQREIEWALKYQKTVISILHNDFDRAKLSEDAQEFFKRLEQYQYIEVIGYNTDAYEIAVNKLLNSLNYQTY
jgi:hypothetical protein